MGVPWAACEMSELISELKEEKEWKSESKHSVGLVLPTRTSWKGRQPDVAPVGRAGLEHLLGHKEAGVGQRGLLCLGGWGRAVHWGFENKSTQRRGGESTAEREEMQKPVRPLSAEERFMGGGPSGWPGVPVWLWSQRRIITLCGEWRTHTIHLFAKAALHWGAESERP